MGWETMGCDVSEGILKRQDNKFYCQKNRAVDKQC